MFVGNFRLEVAQQVAGAEDLDEWAALDALTALVGKSMVQIQRLEPPRYRLLETTRLYASEQLTAVDERVPTIQRHGEAMARLAQDVERDFWTMPDAPWLERYVPDYADLQAAFERAFGRHDTAVAGLAGNALLRIDHLRNVNPAVRIRADMAHTLLPYAAPKDAAWLWNCVATHGLMSIAAVSRVSAARAAVAAWRLRDSAPDLYVALGLYAYECAKAGELAASESALLEASRLEDPAWPARRRMRWAAVVAGVAIYRKDAAAYREASRRELALAEEGGHDRAAAWAKIKLADAALMAGDRAEAIALGQAAVTELGALDQPANLGLALSNLCAAYLLADDVAAARAAAKRALPLMWQNDWGFLLLDQLALVAARTGRCDGAAQILGFTDAWLAGSQERRQPNEAQLAQLAADAIDAALGQDEHARLRAHGAAMTKVDAEALARAVLAGAA